MKYRVVINAGHCCAELNAEGKPADHGACYHGMRECDVNHSVAITATEELVNRGYEVTFVQDDDLQKICDVANGVQANLFISLHCNAFSNEQANGTEVYVYDKSSNAYKAAERICDDICEAINTTNRGVKEGKNLYVLKHTAMPAMLVEMFFISNDKDVMKFRGGFNAIVKAVCDGVDFYFN